MKTFQQNLLVTLALGLCALCAFQWYGQTLQRKEIEGLNQVLYEKSAAIQGYTNSIKVMEGQIAQMDARITEFKAVVKTNDQVILSQKRELNKVHADNEGLTATVGEYKKVVEDLEGKLKEAYDGIKKQNDSIKELATQRDEYVQKFNDSVKDRNDIVAKYNELAGQVRKLQPGGKPEK